MSAPFTSSTMTVKPEWIDYNGHMNMAYYNVLFDQCADEAYALFGIGPDYARSRGMTTYTAEFHICYVRELHLGDKVRVTMQLIDMNDKSFHSYLEIHHEDGWLAATAEAMALHIDMSGPKVTPMPSDVAEKIGKMRDEHANLPRPERLGRVMGIKKKG